MRARAKKGCYARVAPGAPGGRRAVLVVAAAITAALCATAGAASAQEPSEPSSGGGVPSAPGDGSGATDASESSSGGSSGSSAAGSGRLRLKAESTGPGKVFFKGVRKATYQYSIAGSRPRDLKVQAVRRRNGRVVRTWRRDNVEPDTKQTISWAGTNRRGGEAHKGMYVFRVREPDGRAADSSRSKGAARFRLFPHKFPLRGRHQYWDGFGAGRNHMGQDIGARCGSKVVAARGGKVQWRGYQASGAGYYLVIDGKATNHDYVYMHLRRRHRPEDGERVRTGQRIGRIGMSGNSSDCHLHFEIWSQPGWYEGGRAMRSVSKRLKDWDSWS